MGIKQKNKITKPCTECFKPKYLKFNFSYITHEDNFEDKYKIQFFDRMRTLSKEPYLTVINWDKKKAFEFEEMPIKKQIPSRIC